jgi:hypothetical protein
MAVVLPTSRSHWELDTSLLARLSGEVGDQQQEEVCVVGEARGPESFAAGYSPEATKDATRVDCTREIIPIHIRDIQVVVHTP